jgi:hypothetical protein
LALVEMKARGRRWSGECGGVPRTHHFTPLYMDIIAMTYGFTVQRIVNAQKLPFGPSKRLV